MYESINESQKQFRILSDWNIQMEDDGVYYSQCVFDSEKKKAVIYPYHEEEIPSDYFIHEMMHIGMEEIRSTENMYERKEKEELFVQDLCKIFRENGEAKK